MSDVNTGQEMVLSSGQKVLSHSSLFPHESIHYTDICNPTRRTATTRTKRFIKDEPTNVILSFAT